MTRPLSTLLWAVMVAASGWVLPSLEAAAPRGMVLIPAGAYVPVFASGTTQDRVTIDAYYLDEKPVTNRDFLAFVAANPDWRRSRIPRIFAEADYLGLWEDDLRPGPSAPDDAPVVQVSWFAARAYAQWIGRRLPTTAEWERAAAAGFVSEQGAKDPAYREWVLAWYASPSGGVLRTAGSGRPNVYGVRDMIGLIWEWTEDFAAPMGDGDGALVCGSAAASARRFTDYPAFLRAEYRSSLKAGYAMPVLGFRCALSP